MTADPTLADDVRRLAAAAGADLRVLDSAGAALPGWSSASVLLVGADLAAEVAALAPPRRDQVQVVTHGPVPDDLFRVAMAVGAESVVELPRSAGWLTELLTDLGEQRSAAGRLLGVVAGAGGAGATTLACALGQVSGGRRPTLLVDCDPLGPGADRLLGCERDDGARWDRLARTTGRLSARSLRDAVPRRHGVGVVGWGEERARPVPAFALREVLSAGVRGHDLVVADLPRDAAVLAETAPRCDRLLVVVPATVAGVAAAKRLVGLVEDPPSVRLVVRGRAVDAEAVADAVGVPLLAELPDQRGVREALDLGLGPVRGRRGALARTASGLLADVLSGGSSGGLSGRGVA